ncbi:NUDIX hydrolase [Arthrobacter sp. 35W]|uniref:NUDIX hydrolase n=1 Tax=Arthrobacter sp. 35W TaxID=1132441 RepID=UPI00041077AC|nr:NUDIX domain-containing protein [Arthrobacter sp. 35W]
MPAPDFLLSLRAKIGHDPLWLPGVKGVVFDDDGRVLLGQRADTGEWALITGMLDPGEEPASGLLREIFEETAVEAGIEGLVAIDVVGPVTFPNGDVCDFLNIVFRCRYLGGEARVNDDESLDVRWFALDELPAMRPGHLKSIEQALAFDGRTHFAPA